MGEEKVNELAQLLARCFFCFVSQIKSLGHSWLPYIEKNGIRINLKITHSNENPEANLAALHCSYMSVEVVALNFTPSS